VREAARFFIGAIRTVPSILYGVIFVVAFGLGPAAGVMGVALYTVGYLGKFFYETFEGVDPEMYEAVQATGANRLQIFRFVVLPETANAVISQILFMFEYNIRASSILGFVGAGGIGYYMLGYVQMLQYRSLTTAILLTFAVVMLVDAASLRIRTALAHLDTRTHRNPNPRVRSS
jgi:phosphonate transport system permease protein